MTPACRGCRKLQRRAGDARFDAIEALNNWYNGQRMELKEMKRMHSRVVSVMTGIQGEIRDDIPV